MSASSENQPKCVDCLKDLPSKNTKVLPCGHLVCGLPCAANILARTNKRCPAEKCKRDLKGHTVDSLRKKSVTVTTPNKGNAGKGWFS